MKPSVRLGFGLLLLLLLPEAAASDESEPFVQTHEKQSFLELMKAGQPYDPRIETYWPGLQPGDLPAWEQEQLIRWIQYEWLRELPRPDLDTFLDEIRKAHEAYLYATDDRGIERDSRGNPLALPDQEATRGHVEVCHYLPHHIQDNEDLRHASVCR